MSRNPLALGAIEDYDYTLEDTAEQNINYTVVNTEETNIKPFMPPYHDPLPFYLFYEKYQSDHLFNTSQGLETAGQVVGFALDQNFFKNALMKHLSYPVRTMPWFFSPFISANASLMAINRGNRASRPQSILRICMMKMFDDYYNFRSDEQPYIYSLSKLATEYNIPASKYKNRPVWEHEYLILKCVPAKAIEICELEDFENTSVELLLPSSSVPQLPMSQIPTLGSLGYPFPMPPREPPGNNDPGNHKKRVLTRDCTSTSQGACFGPIKPPRLRDLDG